MQMVTWPQVPIMTQWVQQQAVPTLLNCFNWCEGEITRLPPFARVSILELQWRGQFSLDHLYDR